MNSNKRRKHNRFIKRTMKKTLGSQYNRRLLLEKGVETELKLSLREKHWSVKTLRASRLLKKSKLNLSGINKKELRYLIENYDFDSDINVNE